MPLTVEDPVERVLVVDDSPATLKLYRVVLELEGYEVTVASSVREALRRLPQCDPHLLLVDLRLPDGDGFSLARSLGADPAWRALPVVAVSAHSDGRAELDARAAGCSRFLRKPVEPADLVSAVRSAIAGMRPPRPTLYGKRA
ncbi:MAG TPA: response regulator [Gemmatimonadaceae bacterium]|nr:response regulator [Gemmatimonadaceae bacterium]